MTNAKTSQHRDTAWIDIVFDGPPGPESGRFVEVEDDHRAGMSFGEWVERDDGYWCLRIPNYERKFGELKR